MAGFSFCDSYEYKNEYWRLAVIILQSSPYTITMGSEKFRYSERYSDGTYEYR